MKIGRKRSTNSSAETIVASSKPSRNQSKKSLLLILVIVITALLITWVYTMGKKATETVSVIMTSQSIYKNQQITEDMIQPYDMVKAEFEKYATVSESGNVTVPLAPTPVTPNLSSPVKAISALSIVCFILER